MSLKILMIAPTPFFADRGCHVRIYEEARTLQEMGHQVTLCTYSLGKNIPGLDIQRIVRIPWYKKLEAGPSWHKFYLDVLLYLKAKKILRKKSYDLIHAHLHEGVFIASRLRKKFGIPIIGDFQGSLTDEIRSHRFAGNNLWILKIFQFFEKKINHIPDITILSSNRLAELFEKQFKVPKDKTRVVPDGISSQSVSPGTLKSSQLKQKLNIPNHVFVIGYLGLLNSYQGVDLLIKSIPHVIQEIKNVHFLIMGYPHEKHYQKICDKKNIGTYVTFTGRIEYQDVPNHLGICDVAVSPKLSQSEGNGKLMNYMAEGLPTVVFDTPVNREILGDLGIYVSPSTPNDFSKKMVEILKSEPQRQKISPLLKKRAIEHFSWEQKGHTLFWIYEEALNAQIFQDERLSSTATSRKFQFRKILTWYLLAESLDILFDFL
ncbi:MAG: glycosyltransferase family 4 protein [Chlamydiae bacterium]|nr:glycosyltransferase family 4 protein [Chlamydiota bacterium]MBI3267344.1 glycosyltransferase family 4 protein [Chlamydiota bacterium]